MPLMSHPCSGFLRAICAALLWFVLPQSGHAQNTITLQRGDGTQLTALFFAPSAQKQGRVAVDACTGGTLISHGAGGRAQHYSYLAQALSKIGHAVLLLDHPESGKSALQAHARQDSLKDGLKSLTSDINAYQARFLDIEAGRQWLQAHCPNKPTMLLGHSMGAATAVLEAGASNHLGMHGLNRFDAYVALSPQGPGPLFTEDAWGHLKMPILMVTGTRDTELHGAGWQSRTIPFERMPGGCKWLGVIEGASHLNFAGFGMSGSTEAHTNHLVVAFANAISTSACSPSVAHNLQRRGLRMRAK